MKDPKRSGIQAMALTSLIVSQLAGSILIGIFSGRYLDKLLNISPLFLIIGVLAGLATGIYAMLLTVKKYM